MPTILKKFLYSRKFWAFLAGVFTAISAALQDGVITQSEFQTIIALFAAYIFSVAFEDGMSNRVNWNSILPIQTLEASAPPVTTETVQVIPTAGVTVETVQTTPTKE